MTNTKKAIELMPGDVIVDEGSFPRSLYQGTVKFVIVIDAGVEIQYVDGGRIIRPEDHLIKVKA